MSEMVDRVAQAIAPAAFVIGGRECDRKTASTVARAAIAAMREPTEAMAEAGGKIETWCECDGGALSFDIGEHKAAPVWQAMIGAALAENGQ